jgi:hypothetical protein
MIDRFFVPVVIAVAVLGAGSGVPALAGGCKVTVQASNSSDKNIHVKLADSQVRARAAADIGFGLTVSTPPGTWAKLNECSPANLTFDGKSDPKSASCTLEMGCDAERQYRFTIEVHGANGNVTKSIVKYVKSDHMEGGFLEKGVKKILIGDVGKLF